MDDYTKYKGKGEHSVIELEKIIEQREEEIHQLRVEGGGILPIIKNKLGSVTGLMGLIQAKLELNKTKEKDKWVYVNKRIPEQLELAKKSIEYIKSL